jgi:endonuclease III
MEHGNGKLVSLQELQQSSSPPMAGRMFLLNPGKIYANHQLNKDFRQYVGQHPKFLLQYVIAYNNNSSHSMLILREACCKIIQDWVAFHKDCFLVEYHPLHKAYVVLRHLEHSCLIPLQLKSMNDLTEVVHRYILRLSQSFCHKAREHISKYVYGRGVWKSQRKFRIKPLTEDDKIALEKSRDDEYGQFSYGKLSERREQFGSTGRKSLPPASIEASTTGGKVKRGLVQSTITFSPQGHLSLGTLSQVGRDRLSKWLTRTDAKVHDQRFLSEYAMLEAIHQRLIHVHRLFPLRMCWKEVFTGSCLQTPACLKCRPCRMRFSQATMVLVAAQGASDFVILPYLGAVFRHLRYANFSIEEWSSISVEELTMVFRKASKQSQNAMIVHHFLKDFANEEVLPQTIDEIVCYHGFGKKTACLLLDAMGLTNQAGIPVDRHLAHGFRSLGWADPQEWEETTISCMVESWLPPDKWGECNIVCAGLRQVWWQDSTYQSTLRATAEGLGSDHLDILSKLCCKRVEEKETK